MPVSLRISSKSVFSSADSRGVEASRRLKSRQRISGSVHMARAISQTALVAIRKVARRIISARDQIDLSSQKRAFSMASFAAVL